MEPHHLAKIKEFIAAAEQGALAESMSQCMTFMQEAGLMVSMVLKPMLIGVHHSNRDGMGIDCNHLQTLISNISSLGYVASGQQSFEKVCVELSDDPDSDRTRDFNVRLSAESCGKLPAPDYGGSKIRFATVMGSHGNMAARAIEAKCLHPDERLTFNGRLDPLRIPSKWKDDIERGSEWKVISSSVSRQVPQLLCLLQAAGNCQQQVAKNEDEIQMLLKTLAIVNGRKCIWDDVASQVLRSKPRCGPSCPYIFQFIVKYGGSHHLKEAESFIRAHGNASRELGAAVWECLAMDMKGSNSRVYWRHMVIKFAYCSEERQFSATDVAWL